MFRQEFEGHVALQLSITRANDHAHPSGAQRSSDLVWTDAATLYERHECGRLYRNALSRKLGAILKLGPSLGAVRRLPADGLAERAYSKVDVSASASVLAPPYSRSIVRV
jgi:hypothetical protein